MALYVPAGQRRRRAVIAASSTFVLGALIGVVAGRGTASSLDDRIAAVRSDVEQTVAGLRVISLHESSGAAGGQAGDGGTELVLERTAQELRVEFADAPWLGDDELDALLAQVDDLGGSAAEGDDIGDAAEALAVAIEETFGLR